MNHGNETIAIVGIYRGIESFKAFLGGLKWIAIIHSRARSQPEIGAAFLALHCRKRGFLGMPFQYQDNERDSFFDHPKVAQ